MVGTLAGVPKHRRPAAASVAADAAGGAAARAARRARAAGALRTGLPHHLAGGGAARLPLQHGGVLAHHLPGHRHHLVELGHPLLILAPPAPLLQLEENRRPLPTLATGPRLGICFRESSMKGAIHSYARYR